MGVAEERGELHLGVVLTAAGPPEPPWRVILRRGLTAMAAALLGGWAIHLLSGDGMHLVVWMHAFSWTIPLVAVGMLPVALGLRAWWAAGLAGATLFLALPSGMPPAASEPLPSGRPLRVASVNALFVNPHPDALIAEVLAEKPDVVLVQEHTPAMHAALSSEFSHHLDHADARSPFGLGLYSRFPIVRSDVIELQGLPWMRATLEVGGLPVEVWNVHTMPPLDAGKHVRWLGQVATLAAQAERADGVLLVAGDFNLTPANPSYDVLRDAGLLDAHVDCGRWGVRTFPANAAIPPLMRLDYMWLRGGLRCRTIREGTGAGSDHRPVFAELLLPDAR